ncbi:copper homeostasis protein CutC [Yangia mangrovi]|uniref:PF03932 family protein CutC n=1 Tax=Alloyangia mangrovi TaxID=1779329 RepID=A0A2A3JZ58_9RHOB|nr:copper homeostasis protein CutC [Alloyangia mangrovi]MCA0938559.1 copper homeostasis protein CutC [Alloyangia pacifica]MCA0943969.1 copper homeostasis protein CutC [Alloyangia pacifica]MCT4371318.1 copper homeostasis protein CutC [Alloyangia mangrovi]
MTRILEICVDSPSGLAAAIEGGADRIELCAALALGGLTPSPGLISLAARAPIPVMAMIRPRAGGFDWSEEEVGTMEVEIAAVARAGLAGVVIGATRSEAGSVTLDLPVMQRLVAAAKGLDLTLHRCIDLMEDPLEALDQAAALGISRILSSGGAATATEGLARLQGMTAHAGRRLSIMPGAGVSAATLPGLLEVLAPSEVHASASQPDPGTGAIARFGFQPESARRTDAATVAGLKRLLLNHEGRP